MKQCRTCEEWKDESEFYKDKSRKDGLRYCCKTCVKITQKKHYNEHPDIKKDYNQQNSKRIKKYKKQRFKTLKKKWYEGVLCSVCNGNNRISYHHIDKDNKLFSIADVITCPDKYSDADIQAEIDKCVALCTSCHTKLHYGNLKEYEHLWNGSLIERNKKYVINNIIYHRRKK